MDWQAIVIAAIGSGGLTGMVMKFFQLKGEHDKGDLLREDTAIARWKSIADQNERNADRAWRIVGWYRHNYALMWAAYERLPPDEKDKFPAAPPPEID